MKKLTKGDLLNNVDYEKVRNEFRAKTMALKKHRRIILGPNIMLTFENRVTMKFQIQEIMRAERMVHIHQIQEELDVYNSILPDENELSATLFIEITDEEHIRPLLNSFIGLTENKSIWLECDENKIFALFEAGREEEDKISSVHYIRFRFSNDDLNAFRNESNNIFIKIHYNDYQFNEKLTKEIQQSLLKDFS